MRVYEDEFSLAFLDINPVAPGHTLFVPRAHVVSLTEASDEVIIGMAKKLGFLARAVLKGVSAEGCNITVNNGKAAGQAVFHLHWHIIPRYSNDGLKLWPQRSYTADEGVVIAQKIHNALKV